MDLSAARLLYVLLLLFCFSCKPTKVPVATPGDDNQIEVVFLQMNDVYEIAPLEGGRAGGMARVAAIKKQLLNRNPNTYAVMAGDFLNPSVIGNMSYEGSRIRGRQMVEVMNAAGVDVVTFGNHEFDIKEEELLKRLQESTFQWVSSNVLHKTGNSTQPFTSGVQAKPVPKTMVLEAKDQDGTQIKIGVLGLTLPSNKVGFVEYADFKTEATQAYQSLQTQADFVVAITHLDIEDDLEVSKQNQGIRLIMGGHEHTHSYDTVGTAIVAKADANAKTVYVHTLKYNKTNRQLSIQSSLQPVDQTITPETLTDQVVRKWTGIADQSFKALGFDPQEAIFVTTEPLEGRESHMRYEPTNLGKLIAKAISAAAPQSEVAMLNSGSVRVDDQLSGTITQYDILRTLPFAGRILEADMKGTLLEKVLTVGMKNTGIGGYLQTDKAEYNTTQGKWYMDGKLLDPNRTYRVALSDYLLTGQESNLEFLKAGNPEIIKIYEPDASNKSDVRNDIRMAVVAYLRSLRK